MVLLAGLFLAIHTVLRVALLVSVGSAGPTIVESLLIVLVGLLSDFYPLAIACGIGAGLFAIIPSRLWRSRWCRAAVVVASTVILALALLEAVAEALFWAEFHTRFNFLAVEYLIYRDEVAKNILESYSVGPMTGALCVVAALVWWLLRRPLATALRGDSPLRQRALVVAGAVTAATLASVIGEPELGRDARIRELSRNGVYQFISAFRVNEIDYGEFYITRPSEAVMAALRERLLPPASGTTGIARQVTATRSERRLNVMMIAVESLSASFLGVYGSAKGLTPALDALAGQSLWFSNVYATGTRTVRGLEALSLSIPPTPGHSILKRPGSSDGLRTLGAPFIDRGYDTTFFTGAFGYFDNMNGFFSGAGFRIVDRLSYGRDEVTFSNAWGIADEDQFARVLKEADRSHAAGRPFMFLNLTGSNHRPYTFPEGRIDLPQRTRDAAVKYTDWAIGHFLEQARQRPWFESTIFVIVADHCARSGGRTELPVDNFRIPLFIYAPAHIAPQRVTKLVSQIDLAPTLLNLLGFSYNSTFFGQDMLGPGEERAFLGTYNALGLLRGGELTVLQPQERAVAYDIRGDLSYEKPATSRAVDEAVIYYQGAAQVFRNGELKLNGPSRAAERALERRALPMPEAGRGIVGRAQERQQQIIGS